MAVRSLLALAAGMTLVAAAPAGEIEYPKGSLGYNALLSSDLAAAEIQLRTRQGVHSTDPARLINLGYVLAKTGRGAQAEALFKRALEEDDVAVILADGRELSSRTAARLALESLRR